MPKRRKSTPKGSSKKKKLQTEENEKGISEERFPFTSLLIEIQIEILKFVDKVSLCMLRQTSKQLKFLVDKNRLYLHIDAYSPEQYKNLRAEIPDAEGWRLDECAIPVKDLPSHLTTLFMFDNVYPYIQPNFNILRQLSVLILNIDSHVSIECFNEIASNLRILKLWSNPRDTPTKASLPQQRFYSKLSAFAPNLFNLRAFASDYVSDDDIVDIVKYTTALSELTLDGYQISPKTFRNLPSTLTNLCVWNSPNDTSCKPEDFRRISQLTNLRSLDLDRFKFCEHLIPFAPKIRKVKVNTSNVDSHVLHNMSTTVTSLRVFNCPGVDKIPSQIQELQITRTFLSYASLPSGLQSLKWAAKCHQPSLFDQLPSTVTRVSLISSQPVQLDLDKFILPNQLKILCISNFLITDLHFNRFPRTLQAIQITNCNGITDNAVEMLTPSNFPHLRQVSITSESVTKEALSKLPNYVIVYSHTHQNLWFSNIY